MADPYTEKLDDFINQVEVVLEDARTGARKELQSKDLHRLVLRLPILVYRAAAILDTAAIEASISKAASKAVYSEYFIDSAGTIPEREAFATLKAAEESVIVDLSRHVYNRVKDKIDAAKSLLDAVKKVIGSKDTELQVFGRDKS